MTNGPEVAGFESSHSHRPAGWTRKSYQRGLSSLIVFVVLFVLLFKALGVHAINEWGFPAWINDWSYVPLLALVVALQLWTHRRFERSAEPSAEQYEAWEEVKKYRNRNGLVLVPATVTILVLMNLSLPWYIWFAPFVVAMAYMLFFQRGHKLAAKRFEDSLIRFDESWDESPLATETPGSDPGANAR